MTPLALLGRLGAATLGLLASLGRLSTFVVSTFSHMLRPPFYGREVLNALLQVGWLSLPVVGLTAIFTGGALALQIYAGGARVLMPRPWCRRSSPLAWCANWARCWSGLMIAARVTSSIAAEIATMKVTEQIDALVTLSTHPMKYLVAPRVLAGLLTVPALVGIGDIIGIMGGYVVATQNLGFNAATYLVNTVNFLEIHDMISSLVKGAVFGVIATTLGCYYGMNSGRGAQGVGRATKSSVETAAVLILAANFVLTGVFFSL